MPEVIGTSKSIYGFDPRSVPGCILWLDALDNSALVISGGTVPTWYDKSGLGNTATASAFPLLCNSTINGNQSILFSNASGGPGFHGTFSTPVTSSALSVFAVASTLSPTGLGRDQRLVSLVSNASTASSTSNYDYNTTTGIMPFDQQSSGNFTIYRNGGPVTYIVNTSSTPFVASMVYDGSACNIAGWFNGSAFTYPLAPSGVAAQAGSLLSSNYGVGCDAWTTSGLYAENWYGYIGEVLIYSNALTTTQRQAVEGYLARKWGFTTTPFLPTSITGCTTWYDASDPSTWLASNGFMQTVRDKSGSNNHLNNSSIAGSSNWPVLGSINGLPAMMFGLTNQGSSNTVSLAYTTNSITVGPSTVFCVAMFTGQPAIQPGGYGTGGYGQLFMDNYAGQRQCFINNGGLSNKYFDSNSLVEFEANSGNYYYTPGIQVRGSNIPFLIECSYTTSGGTLVWGNGAASPGSGTATSTGNSQWYIGGGNGGAQSINACIGEFITYNTQLSAANRQLVEAYLISKWGIDYTASLISNATSPTSVVGSVSIANQAVASILLSTYTSNAPFASLQPFTRVFQPTDIPRCTLWLDGADSSTITGGVTSVREKANGITFTATGTVTTSTIGTTPSLNFGGAGYLSGAVNNLLIGTSFVVFKATAANSGYYPFFTWRDNAGQSNFPAFGYIPGGSTIAPYTTSVGNGTPTNTATIGNTYLTSYSWSKTTTGVGINGVTPTSGTQPAFASTETLMWIAYDNGSYTTTNIGEIILYSSVLTTTERQSVEGYLAGKWRIPISTTNHPYYSIPPSTQAGEIYTKFVIAVLDPTVGLSTSTATWYETIAGTLSNVAPGWRSGTGLGWTLSGSPTVVSTGPSVALSLNGTNQYVYSGTITQLSAFTIDIWIYPTAVRNACVVGETGGSSYNYTLLYLSSSGGIYSGPYYYNSGAGPGMGVGSYTSNQWYNIVITNTGGTNASGGTYGPNSSLVSYVNGVQTNSAAYVRWAPAVPVNVVFGSNTNYNSQSTGYFQGYIGGYKHYAVALSPAQVQQNYNAWAWRFKMPISSTPFALPGGLAFHLDAGNPQSYPGSGSTWTDLVTGVAMTLVNSPTYVSSNGGYMNFVPGSSQYAYSTVALQTLPAWSIEVWHYYTATFNAATNQPSIVTQIYPGSTSAIQYTLGSTTITSPVLQTGFYNAGWNSTSTSYAFPSSNAWYHIVGTYSGPSGGLINLYINGALAISTANTATAASNTSGINLMKRWDNPDYWGGGLATVRIYSKSLTSLEISNIFSATRSRFGI